jgi:hypothetical protein
MSVPRLNPPFTGSVIEVPPAGTVTSISSGTGVLAPIEWLREINTTGIKPGDLAPLLEELEAEQELAADMVSYRKNVTGVDHTIFVSVEFPRHAPRIKVAIDPPTHLDPLGKNASVTIHDGKVVEGDIPARLLNQVSRFLDINRSVLLEYWNKRIDTDELRQRLKSI